MVTSGKGLILAGIDASDLLNLVVEHAIWISKNSQTPVKFLHTIEHSHHSEKAHHEGNLTPNMKEHLLDELTDEERQESKKLIADGKVILNNARQTAEKAGLTDIIAKQRHGTLPEALLDLESEIRMVVLGSQGEDHQGNKKGLGSQLEAAIRAIHKPIFIVKVPFSEPKKLMFAFNGSPTSRKVLEVLKQNLFFNHTLAIHVVSVQNNLDEAQQLTSEAQAVLSKENITVTTKALTGDPMEGLIGYQRENDIDIIAMGAFSHGKLRGFFFGSFTTRLLLESPTNFLLIR